MASSSQPLVYDAPSSFKSKVWVHFGFYKKYNSKDLDMQYAICKECQMKVKYSGNTTNLRAHLTRYHLDMNRNISQNRIAILAVSQYVKNRNNIESWHLISQYYRIVKFLPIPTPNKYGLFYHSFIV